MSANSLPANPSLDHLRGQARALQRAVRAGDRTAAGRVGRGHPEGVPVELSTFPLSAAQLVIAREYGFPSWPRLKASIGTAADPRTQLRRAIEDGDLDRVKQLVADGVDHRSAYPDGRTPIWLAVGSTPMVDYLAAQVVQTGVRRQ